MDKKREDVPIKPYTGCKKLYFNGAVNSQDHKGECVQLSDSVNLQSSIELLKIILDNNTHAKFIYAVSDITLFYKWCILLVLLESHLKIALFWLFTYSLNLSFIERPLRIMQ